MNKKCKHKWDLLGEAPNFNLWSGYLMGIEMLYECSKCGHREIEKRPATRADYIEYGERIEVDHDEPEKNN